MYLLFPGCLTPFRSITIFCAYSGAAVAFVYFYMITFTAACMVYSGRREEANRHPFSCRKVLPKAQAGMQSTDTTPFVSENFNLFAFISETDIY